MAQQLHHRNFSIRADIKLRAWALIVKIRTFAMSILAISLLCFLSSDANAQPPGTWSGFKVKATIEECKKSGPEKKDPWSASVESSNIVDVGVELTAGLLKSGTDLLARWIELQKNNLGSIRTATFLGQLYKEIPGDLAWAPRCIVAVDGTFGTSNSATQDTKWTASELKDLGLAESPRLYLEMRPFLVDKGKFFTLKIAYLDYRVSGAKTPGTGAKNVVLMCQFTKQFISSGSIQKLPFGTFTFDLGKLQTGTVITEDSLSGIYGGLAGVPAASKPINGPADKVLYEMEIKIVENEQPSFFFEVARTSLSMKEETWKDIIKSLLPSKP